MSEQKLVTEDTSLLDKKMTSIYDLKDNVSMELTKNNNKSI